MEDTHDVLTFTTLNSELFAELLTRKIGQALFNDHNLKLTMEQEDLIMDTIVYTQEDLSERFAKVMDIQLELENASDAS